MYVRRHRVLCLVLATSLPHCSEPAIRHETGADDCPGGTAFDPPRAATLLDGVKRTQAGARALARLDGRDYRVCFGGLELGSLRAGGVLVLDRSAPDGPSVARLVHLLEHLADALDRFPAPDVPCPQQLDAVIASEARAIVAELDTRRELGLEGGAPHGLTDQLRGLAAHERHALLERHLRAPDDQASPDLAELMRSYTARCEQPRAPKP